MKQAPVAATGVAGLDDVLGGGFTPQPPVPGRRACPARARPRSRCSSCSRARAAASRCSTSRCRRPRRSCARSPPRTAGRSTASRSASWCRPRRAWSRTSSTRCSIRPRSSSPRRRRRSSTTSSDLKPTRVVFDSLSELRLLAGNPLRYRRQILALKQFFAGRRCTVLLLDDRTAAEHDLQVQSIAHGVLAARAARCRRTAPTRRRLRVHQVPRRRFPRRLSRLRHPPAAGWRSSRAWSRPSIGATSSRERLASGVAGARPAARRRPRARHQHADRRAPRAPASRRSPRSSRAAAERGEHAAIFIFDESVDTLLSRCDGLGIPLREHVDAGTRQRAARSTRPSCRPASSRTRSAARSRSTARAIVVIDSLNGYLNAMPGGALPHRPAARAADLPRPARRGHAAGRARSTGLIGSRDERAGRRELPRRRGDAAALLRGARRGAPGDLGGQEARRRARAHDPRVPHRRRPASSVGEPLRDFRGVLTGVPENEGASG